MRTSNRSRAAAKPETGHRPGASRCPAAAHGTARLVLVGLLLAVAVGIAHIPAMRADFIWDDNYALWQLTSSAAHATLADYWFSTKTPDYWPLTSTVFWVNWRLWGKNPTGYHVQNILLHALNSVLLWLVLRRLKIPGAWFAGLLFGLHPVNAASVAWISELKNTLSQAFLFGALLAWLRFERSAKAWGWYVAAFVLFLLALLSKTAVVGLPVVLLVLAWWQRGRLERRDVVRSVPFFLAALALGLTTIWFHMHNAIGDGAVITPPANAAARLAGAGMAAWFYVSKALLPRGLCMIYPHWRIVATNPLVYVPGVTLAALLVIGFVHRERAWARHLFAAQACFLVMILPVLGFVDMSYMMHSLVADHLQYSAIAFVIAPVVAVATVVTGRLRMPRRLAGALLGLGIAAVFGFLTWQRTHTMRGHIPLWRDTIARNPAAWMAYFHLGTELGLEAQELQAQGRQAEAHERFREAADWLEQGARLKPTYADMYNNLALSVDVLGDSEEAVRLYQRGVELSPQSLSIWHNLGLTLAKLKRFDEAESAFRNALRIFPDAVVTRYHLAQTLAAQRRAPDAIREVERVLEIAPNEAAASLYLAGLLAEQERFDEATPHVARAVQLVPGWLEARLLYANILVRQQSYPSAAEHLTVVADNQPGTPELQNDVGVLLTMAGRPRDALARFDHALMLNPRYALAHNNRGQALEALGRRDEAAAAYQAALAISPGLDSARENLARLEPSRQ